MAEAMSINHAVVMEVRDLIKAKGMSISGVARVTGISRGTLVNYITRERSSMPFDVVDEVARALGLTLDELARRAEARRAIANESSSGGDDPDGPRLRGL